MSLRILIPSFALSLVGAVALSAFPPLPVPPSGAPAPLPRYDSSQEKNVSGQVTSVTVDQRGPSKMIVLSIETSDGDWTVLAGPAAAHVQQGLQISEGDTLTAIGAPVPSPDGTLLLARTITRGDTTLTLLDSNGVPMVLTPFPSPQARAGTSR